MGCILGSRDGGTNRGLIPWHAVSQDCSAKSSSSVRLFLFRSLLCERNIWALHCSHQVRLLGGCSGAAAHPASLVSVSISIIQSRAERERRDSRMPFLPPASLWWDRVCHPAPCLHLSGGGSCLGFHSLPTGSGHPSHVGACGLFYGTLAPLCPDLVASGLRFC